MFVLELVLQQFDNNIKQNVTRESFVLYSRDTSYDGFLAETRNYSIFWLSLPVHSGSLKRINYSKQICLAYPLSFY